MTNKYLPIVPRNASVMSTESSWLGISYARYMTTDHIISITVDKFRRAAGVRTYETTLFSRQMLTHDWQTVRDALNAWRFDQ